MNTVLFVNATIGFSENLFLVNYFDEKQNNLVLLKSSLIKTSAKTAII